MTIIYRPQVSPLAKWQFIGAHMVGMDERELSRMDYHGAKDALFQSGLEFVRHSYRGPKTTGLGRPMNAYLFNIDPDETVLVLAPSKGIFNASEAYFFYGTGHIIEIMPPEEPLAEMPGREFGAYVDRLIHLFTGMVKAGMLKRNADVIRDAD